MMGSFSWYLSRLGAMTPAEMAGHVRKKLYRVADARGFRGDARCGEPQPDAWPKLPDRSGFSSAAVDAIRGEAEQVKAGNWTLFREVECSVDQPPRWQMDYLAGVDLETTAPFPSLNHRDLGAADIKLIWDLNRWTQLVRMAQAAWLDGDREAAGTVASWLEDWHEHNPPYRGWNWTSALETGIRLIQFCWLDALLVGLIDACRWQALRDNLVPAHASYTWRHRSFGSSANNHWLGELTALIVTSARWPDAVRHLPPLARLHEMLDVEVERQFHPDGGNREHAFHYHLFSFEFLMHAVSALACAGESVSASTREQIKRAASFLAIMQSPDGRWDYGDSDDAVLVPFGLSIPVSTHGWAEWVRTGKDAAGYGAWLGASPYQVPTGNLQIFSDSGYAVMEDKGVRVRFDASPLGFLSIAAHGHVDALHASFWFHGQPLIIDPGTGAYYGDPGLRSDLASAARHNGPVCADRERASRAGPFLWKTHHPVPRLRSLGDRAVEAELREDERTFIRSISMADDRMWIVVDRIHVSGEVPVSVCWTAAPGVQVEKVDGRSVMLTTEQGRCRMSFGGGWGEVNLEPDLRVSPSFRVVSAATGVRLSALVRGSANLETRLEFDV